LVLKRRVKYYYLKLLRLKGDPHDLAMGMALGVFAGTLPALPFQSALAIALALLFRASKITALLGTWISNPLNWYFLYFYSYKIGAGLMGIKEKGKSFSTIIDAIKHSGDPVELAGTIFGAGGWTLAAFFLGGLVLSAFTAPVFYCLSLYFFRAVKRWRENRRMEGKRCPLFPWRVF